MGGPPGEALSGVGAGRGVRRDATNRQGRFVLVNVPPGEGELRLEIIGALVEDGPLELVGCEQVPTVTGGMAYRSLGPLRSDGPEACR